jgi:hypothetical protein
VPALSPRDSVCEQGQLSREKVRELSSCRRRLCLDRDCGAPTNFHYKAVFYMRSGGFYPPQYITKEELEKRKKLVGEFLLELEIVHIDNSGAKSANGGP